MAQIHFRSLAKSGATGVAIVGMTVGLTVATAGAPARAAAGSRARSATINSLTSGGVRFRADGHTWSLQVNAASDTTVTVSIGTPFLHGTEEHVWVFHNARNVAFRVNESTGRATLNTHSSLSPVVALDLTFTPTSRKKSDCMTGSGTEFTGSLSGRIALATGLRRVKFRAAHATFSRRNMVDVSHRCVPPRPCGGGVWTSGTSPTMVSGSTPSPFEPVPFEATVTKVVKLTRPANASRADSAVIKAPEPVFDSAANSLTVKGSSSGIVTGQAVLSHAAVIEPLAVPCTSGGKNHVEILTEHLGTTYASKAGHPFKARTLLSGTLAVKASGLGMFVIVSKGS